MWAPPVAYASIIFVLSAQSRPLPELTALVWDKFLHGVEYAGLGLLICRALRGERLAWGLSVALAIVLASAYAGSDEWHQSMVPGRNSDVHDWIADTCGGSIGSLLYWPLAAALKARATAGD